MCGHSYPMHAPPAHSAELPTTYPSGRKQRRRMANSDHSGPSGCRGWGTLAATTSTLKTAGHLSAAGGRVGEEVGGLGLGLGRGFGLIAEGGGKSGVLGKYWLGRCMYFRGVGVFSFVSLERC